MLHHALKQATKHAAKFYAVNPHKVTPHATTAVQIGSIAWMHSHKAAKHTMNFMANAAVKGFNLFRS